MARAGAFACFALSYLFGCDGTVVNLGNTERLSAGGDAGAAGSAVGGSSASSGSGGGPEWIRNDEPVLGEQENKVTIASPALPGNAEYLLFTRQKRGFADAHIWKTSATSTGFAKPDFDSAQPLSLGEDPELGVSSPALSTDGSELWFGMTVPDSTTGTDIYVAVGSGGEWGTPQRVAELSTVSDDAPRPPGLHGTAMPLSSKDHGGPFFQIYLAYRDAVGAPWHEVNQIHLENVNAAGTTVVDGFLSEDGLTLYFAAGMTPESADLFRARRGTPDQSFDVPERLDDLNTTNDERDPWLSQGGEWLYYTSNREGVHAIYRARRATP